jgi:hypothetical protein
MPRPWTDPFTTTLTGVDPFGAHYGIGGSPADRRGREIMDIDAYHKETVRIKRRSRQRVTPKVYAKESARAARPTTDVLVLPIGTWVML